MIARFVKWSRKQVTPPRRPIAPIVVAAVAVCATAIAGPASAKELWETLEARGYLSDYAALLPAEREAEIEARLRQLHDANGVEFSVVTLKSMEGGQIDDFAFQLFNRWGIGKQGADNGLLLLVAVEERKARIEVGYGLEAILPDALAGRVLDEDLFPAFREGRYDDGLVESVTRLARIVERNEPAAFTDRHGILAPDLPPGQIWLALPFLAAFVAVGSFLCGAGLGSKTVFLVPFGAFFAGVPTLMGLVMCGYWSIFVHWPLAAYCGYVGFRKARRNPATFRGERGRRRYNSAPTTWIWGASSGGRSSGGGFSSSGGFGGFGGGSSGGGGASGGW